MSEMSLDFLFSEEEIEGANASLPESEGSFLQGNVGPWMHQIMWYTNDGLVQDVSGVQSFIDSLSDNMRPDHVSRKGYGTSYYFGFNRLEDAKALHAELGKEYSPRLTWNWRIKSSEIMNWTFEDRTAEDTFGEYLDVDSDIPTTYGNDYNRHEFHMYVMPSFVQSIATVMRQDPRSEDEKLFDLSVEWPIFDFDSLWKIDTDKWDKEFAKADRPKHDIPQELTDIQREWVGTDGSNYQDSKLWGVRNQVWDAIREENTSAYKTDSNSKFASTSSILRRILFLMESTMIPNKDGVCQPAQGFYYRVNTRVPNLRANAVTKWNPERPEKSGSRVNGFVISEMYPDEKAAKDALGEESTDNAGFLPALPEGWNGSTPEEYTEFMKEFLKGKVDISKPWPTQKSKLSDKALEDSITTMGDLETWWGFLQ